MKTTYVDIHTHKRSGNGIEVLSVMAGYTDHYPDPPFSIGIHPWQLAGSEPYINSDPTQLNQSLECIKAANASAVGEIGLDFAKPSDHNLQEMVFNAQLQLAAALNKPVIIHSVKAFEATMKILAKYDLPAVIFHGFIGSTQQAALATGKGYYLSFGERSLKSPKTLDALKHTSLSNMFLETDESHLAISTLYSCVAEALALSVLELIKHLNTNYETVFKYDSNLARAH